MTEHAATATDPVERAIAYAADRGREDGKAAASWYFDGNTPTAAYARILRGIEDGDPAILDTFPFPDLSGEWADTLTGPQLVIDAWTDAFGAYVSSVDAEAAGDAFSSICDAYEFAFTTAAADEIERAARYQVAD